MENIEKTTILEYINYIQLITNRIDKYDFNKYAVSNGTLTLLKIYDYLTSSIHQLNDDKLFKDDYQRAIFDMLDIEMLEFDDLISYFFQKYKYYDIEKPITQTEFQNGLQCIRFIVSTDKVDVNKFGTIREIMIVLKEIEKLSLFSEKIK